MKFEDTIKVLNNQIERAKEYQAAYRNVDMSTVFFDRKIDEFLEAIEILKKYNES